MTRIVTVHTRSSYSSDQRLVCDTWLLVAAVRWDARRRGLRTTTVRLGQSPAALWWAMVKARA